MKRIILSVLVVMIAAGTVSAQKKAKKTKSAKKEVAAAVLTPAKPDTVGVDQFSYFLGYANTNGLKPFLQQRQGMDTLNNMNDFIRGFNEAINKANDPALKAYSAGLQIGDQVVNQMFPAINKQITDNPDSNFVNQSEFVRGFLAALQLTNPTITMDSAMNVTERNLKVYHADLMEKKYGDNRKAGEEFLAQNAKKDSVVSLPSGVQYKVIKQGTGRKPEANSKVEVNYEGRLIDGTVFDSSYKRNKPQEFGIGGLIPGFAEALQQMPEGSEWEIYIPQNLAYGDRENPNSPIKPFSALIFKVELLSVKDAPQPKIPARTPAK